MMLTLECILPRWCKTHLTERIVNPGLHDEDVSFWRTWFWRSWEVNMHTWKNTWESLLVSADGPLKSKISGPSPVAVLVYYHHHHHHGFRFESWISFTSISSPTRVSHHSETSVDELRSLNCVHASFEKSNTILHVLLFIQPTSTYQPVTTYKSCNLQLTRGQF